MKMEIDEKNNKIHEIYSNDVFKKLFFSKQWME